MDKRPTPDEVIKMEGLHWLDKRLSKKIDLFYARWDHAQREKELAKIPKPPKPAYQKKQGRPYIYDVRKTGQRPAREDKYDPLVNDWT